METALSIGAQAMLQYIREQDWYTFPELQRVFERAAQISAHGSVAIEMDGFPNVILWLNCSEEFFTAISHLINEGIVIIDNASMLAYASDCHILDFPILRRLPRNRSLTNPHWFLASIRPNILGSLGKRIARNL